MFDSVLFAVDASEGGVGNLEVAVNEGKIASMAHPLGQHRYDISFVPVLNVDHHISVRFNNEPVPGSPFLCRLLSAVQVQANGPGLERVAVGRQTEFSIVVDEPAPGGKGPANPPLPQVQIIDLKGNRLPVAVVKDPRAGQKPGHFLAQYTPKTVGNHQVEVSAGSRTAVGSCWHEKFMELVWNSFV